MADEAERIGMIYKSCDEDSFNPFVENLLNTLAHGATKGLGWTKQLLNDAWTNGLEQQLSSESHWQTKAGQSRDFKEGVQAFLEKRKPSFEGK